MHELVPTFYQFISSARDLRFVHAFINMNKISAKLSVPYGEKLGRWITEEIASSQRCKVICTGVPMLIYKQIFHVHFSIQKDARTSLAEGGIFSRDVIRVHPLLIL